MSRSIPSRRRTSGTTGTLRNITSVRLLIIALTVLECAACGSSSPTAPSAPTTPSGPPTVGINNQPNLLVPNSGSSLTMGTPYSIGFDMNAGGAGAVVVGIVIVRDDGMMWLPTCGTITTGPTSKFSMSGTIGPTDGLYISAKGHVINAIVLTASGPSVPIGVPGPCYFGNQSNIDFTKAQTKTDLSLNWTIVP